MTKAELERLGITRIFQRFDHNQRADMMTSHRLGYRQRQRIGEFFYVSSHIPGIGFRTRGAAVKAAQRALDSRAIEAAQKAEAA